MANAPISHSMIVINANHWIGANNVGTFNPILQNAYLQILPLGRTEISNIGVLGAYNPITGIFNNGQVQSVHIFR